MKAGKYTLLAIVLASAVFSAQAQTVPKPKEFYFDEDRAAAPVVAVTGVEGAALVDQLSRRASVAARWSKPPRNWRISR